ncbi:MAG: cytochrome P450 [Solirubrobacteraceae bacterium]
MTAGPKAAYPRGASVTLEQLDCDPHPFLAALRKHEPVSWVPAFDGWLVTRHDLALAVMRDAAGFTVDDPRFSTARVTGPSMLSLDGDRHASHRAPFVAPFRPRAVSERFARAVENDSARLIDGFQSAGATDLRASFAGPLAAATMTRALGLEQTEIAALLGWYEAIVSAVDQITAGQAVPETGIAAFDALAARVLSVIRSDDQTSLLVQAAATTKLTPNEIVSNAAILLFGGIETTAAMITNAALALLQEPAWLEQARHDQSVLDRAIEESLRLEPAAAVIDRYATRDAELGSAQIARGDLVRISISAANRDPAVYSNPDSFDPSCSRPHGHLAFAQGPHVCVGIHLARLEGRVALTTLLRRLPTLRLDPTRPARVRGLVFRKPHELCTLWD